LLLFASAMFVQGSFRAIAMLTASSLLTIRNVLIKFGVSIALVIVLYFFTRFQVSHRLIVGVCSVGMLMGYTVVVRGNIVGWNVVCLCCLTTSVCVYLCRITLVLTFMFVHGALSTLPAMLFAGGIINYGSRNLLYGVITTIFAGLLPQGGKVPLWFPCFIARISVFVVRKLSNNSSLHLLILSSQGTLLGVWMATAQLSEYFGTLAMNQLTTNFVLTSSYVHASPCGVWP